MPARIPRSVTLNTLDIRGSISDLEAADKSQIISRDARGPITGMLGKAPRPDEKPEEKASPSKPAALFPVSFAPMNEFLAISHEPGKRAPTFASEPNIDHDPAFTPLNREHRERIRGDQLKAPFRDY